MRNRKIIVALSIIFLVIMGGFGLSKPAGNEKSVTNFTATNFFGNGWILRKEMPVFCDPKLESVHAHIYQKGAKLRVAFSLPSGSDHKNVDCILSFNPMYFFVKGKPILVDTKSGNKRYIDYKFENDHLFFKVYAKDDIKYIEFEVASRMLKNIASLSIEDKLKQARTIRRIRQRLKSWSPLASGQIIAQETLRAIVSHGGYAANGTKKAVIWANNSKLTGGFELLDALKNRQHPDKQSVVYTGDLKETGNHIWGGNNYIADFSDFRKEGLYFIRLKVNETREVTDSYVFPIRKTLYLDLAVKAATWFNYQRCGTEVSGFHKACHTQDTIIKIDGTKVDVTGGWHDAGDYGKWIWGGSMGLFGLSAFQGEFSKELNGTLEGMPKFINEIAWEAKYFCKTYWDGAFHPCFTPNFENVCVWLGAPEKEPARVVLEEECLKNDYGIIKGPAICLPGAVLAKAGRLILPYDKKLGEKCISIAKDVYEKGSKMKLSNLYYIKSGLLLIDLELYQVYKEKKYKEDARQKVRSILELQDEEGFFYNDKTRTSMTIEPGMHMPALYEFLKSNPEGELTHKVKKAFKRWAEYIMQFANLSPFGQIGGKAKDGSVRNIVPHTNNRKFGDIAWGLATSSLLLKEPEYLKAAERQIQWIVGFNPADISMMAGVGRGPGCYHHRYCFMEGCVHGVVPGGIMIGIYSGIGKVVELGDITKNFVIADVPIDYPIFDTDVYGWTYAYKTSEYALSKNASFIRGAFQIEKALRELSNQ